ARVEVARVQVAATREEAERAESRVAPAVEAETSLRGPLEEAERDVHRLEAEIRALSHVFRSGSDDLWPPLIDSLKVQPGYEAALAAALGDDLDAPLDEAAPNHWRDLGELEGLPLPAG